ncbi:hypothetical protein [Paludibacterium yongneupense]|uniref:hypothetical protein n=1 Tax=Paludibacterium yongneupense TaxID=400061 RepID=UPI000417E46D|nr:hypothetical protein [Paludibacterium yongneupense]
MLPAPANSGTAPYRTEEVPFSANPSSGSIAIELDKGSHIAIKIISEVADSVNQTVFIIPMRAPR